MKARWLLRKIEEPVHSNDRNCRSSQSEEPGQSRWQTGRSGETRHGHDFTYRLERESAVQSTQVKNKETLRSLTRIVHHCFYRQVF